MLFLDYFWLELKQQVVCVSQGSLLKDGGNAQTFNCFWNQTLSFLTSHIIIPICHIVNLLESVLVNLCREMLVFQIYNRLI